MFATKRSVTLSAHGHTCTNGVNGNCAGTGGVYRVDRADDLGWLYSAFGKHLR